MVPNIFACKIISPEFMWSLLLSYGVPVVQKLKWFFFKCSQVQNAECTLSDKSCSIELLKYKSQHDPLLWIWNLDLLYMSITQHLEEGQCTFSQVKVSARSCRFNGVCIVYRKLLLDLLTGLYKQKHVVHNAF